MKQIVDEIINGLEQMDIANELKSIENETIRKRGLNCDYIIEQKSLRKSQNEYYINLTVFDMNSKKEYKFSGFKYGLIKRMKEVFNLNETMEE